MARRRCADRGHGACAGPLYRRGEPPTYCCRRHIQLRHFWYSLPWAAVTQAGSFTQWIASLPPARLEHLLQSQGELGERYWNEWEQLTT